MRTAAAPSARKASATTRGRTSARLPRKKPLAVAGYALAALGKPLIGLATIWPVALAGRATDRLGSGARTAPRDALIAGSVSDADRGRALGPEGLGDNAGADLGPTAPQKAPGRRRLCARRVGQAAHRTGNHLARGAGRARHRPPRLRGAHRPPRRPNRRLGQRCGPRPRLRPGRHRRQRGGVPRPDGPAKGPWPSPAMRSPRWASRSSDWQPFGPWRWPGAPPTASAPGRAPPPATP